MKSAKSDSVASLTAVPAQYASTPHLFVFQANEEAAVLHKPEPIYQSAVDVRAGRLAAARRISERYDSYRSLARDADDDEQPLAVSQADVAQVESFFAGHKTSVIVCRALANMYLSSESNTWELKYTGIPTLVSDSGETRSRCHRQLQLVLAEKGTGFMLWRDVVDDQSAYAAPDPSFHTMHLSSDQRQRMGLSFDDIEAANAFRSQLDALCAGAKGDGSPPTQKKRKSKRAERHARPRKEDISQPCCFQHVTSVSLQDMDRFYTLQSLVGSRAT
ncbi:uncharacterized protein LOC119091825 [Pollicipes pollicipes]|uniref:uncharacterized protein LOC119091825 n=1 Tax=Pollicipes pollicipes TaxID=41117 RepID=UPI001885509A|nr:uncharacterized protein LOC119091825 [Pollicipes pollicipes]XP_037070611.1 uncharacterized protein LOC119091825 [Pollicipes pollicipes]